ncbi:MAG: DUF6033 family protein [Lachnospiraceae bacterium]|nr:DUF6033 family protein [Lachnospiraceae bacterium]
MAGIFGVSAYQQIDQTREAALAAANRANQSSVSKTDPVNSVKDPPSSRIKTKEWSPIDTGSSLVPRKTEYGYTIGNVQLSDAAKDYYDQLKSKFGNMEFIAVSKDMKAQVQKHAASYGNANKVVVLMDEEKLERMATDPAYRKKYEGIIAMSEQKLKNAKNGLASTGANVKNFGMSVDSGGKESFFATVDKTSEIQKMRIAKKTAEKRADKAREKKKAEKEAFKERIEKKREEKAEEKEAEEIAQEAKEIEKEYVTFEAPSLESLLSRVSSYSFENAEERVMTDAEKMQGTQIDYKG